MFPLFKLSLPWRCRANLSTLVKGLQRGVVYFFIYIVTFAAPYVHLIYKNT